MIVDRKVLSKAICSVLSNPKIGQLCVLSNDNGTRPMGEYTTVGTPRISTIARDSRKYKNETTGPDLDETIAGLRSLDFSVTCYRGDAADRAERARMAFRQTWVQEELLKTHLAFTSISEVRNLTEVEDAGMSDRFQFDVTLMTEQSITDVVLAIESVVIIGHYEGAFHEHTQTLTLEKP